MSPVVVLRPEPGNAATAARLAAVGLTAIRQPIFAARALDWTPPDPVAFDALLVTSAQAPRLAGTGLAALASLAVVAVGERSADAARAAGLRVAIIGTGDAAKAIEQARAAGFARLLHLAGRDRTASTEELTAAVVYESVQVRVPEVPAGATVLLHSVRAAQALAAAPIAREAVTIVAISEAVRAAAGEGWGAARVAAAPTDAALVAAARATIDPPQACGDNAA